MAQEGVKKYPENKEGLNNQQVFTY